MSEGCEQREKERRVCIGSREKGVREDEEGTNGTERGFRKGAGSWEREYRGKSHGKGGARERDGETRARGRGSGCGVTKRETQRRRTATAAAAAAEAGGQTDVPDSCRRARGTNEESHEPREGKVGQRETNRRGLGDR